LLGFAGELRFVRARLQGFHAMPRPPKKSETLEIRLPHPTKQAFMARCRADGRSASEALRGFIEREIEAPARRPANALRWVAGAALALAAGAAAVPSLAHPAGDFQRLDRNDDGRITAAELLTLDTDGDGQVSAAEFRSR
jgi:hypothetical protein